MNVTAEVIMKTLPDGNILRLKKSKFNSQWVLQWHKANKHMTNWVGLGSSEDYAFMKNEFDNFNPKTFVNRGNYPDTDRMIKRIRETGW